MENGKIESNLESNRKIECPNKKQHQSSNMKTN